MESLNLWDCQYRLHKISEDHVAIPILNDRLSSVKNLLPNCAIVNTALPLSSKQKIKTKSPAKIMRETLLLELECHQLCKSSACMV